MRLIKRFLPMPAWFATLVVVLALLVFFNLPLWRFVGRMDDVGRLSAYGFWLVGGFYYAVISLFALPRVHKVIMVVLLVVAAVVTPLMMKYGVLIDAAMIHNAVETDLQETRELITVSGCLWLVLGGLLPALVLWRLPVSYPQPTRRGVAAYGVPVLLGLVVAVAAGWAGMRDIAPFYRTHREVRHIVVPYNAIAGTVKYARQQLAAPKVAQAFTPSAAQKTTWLNDKGQRRVIVFVVGETARAGNFGLGGYVRQTTPRLAARGDDIAYFSDFSSCGTSTAVSVPCMFSSLGRGDFSSEGFARSDTVLQQAAAAGFKTIWIDNNSGCKGACRKEDIMDLAPVALAHPSLCADGECLDGILVEGLRRALTDESGRDLFIVLHMKGSHGPLYYKRFPQEMARYTPYCRQASLNACPRAEVVNAYDNTILYSDSILDAAITALEQQSDDATALFYVSDHGESLGEGGLYLHGAPYMLAPREQTHVPAALWLSRPYQTASGVTTVCLRGHAGAAFSHDNVFAGLLDLAGIASVAPVEAGSFLAGCGGTVRRAGDGGR